MEAKMQFACFDGLEVISDAIVTYGPGSTFSTFKNLGR